jgi:alkanesulfonate monooxygenase SsuD/methylene tetrahydromethanopterin reductase-like flavin-dependent oxidoreductase (luciferase family)
VLLSVCLDPGRTWADTLALAHGAEEAGLATVFVCDHFMPHDESGRAVAGPVLEGWSVLSALAVATPDVTLGTLVLGATYRPAGVVASMSRTLAEVSRGRLLLGLGAGWQPNEHAAYGIDLPPPGPRLRAFEAYVVDVRSALGAITVPLLIGGGGEQRTMRVAARHADAWHVWGPAERFAAKNAVMDERCAEIGREPGTLRRVSGEGVDPGTPDAAVRRLLDRYRAAGCDELVLRDHRDDPVEAALATVRQVAAVL